MILLKTGKMLDDHEFNCMAIRKTAILIADCVLTNGEHQKDCITCPLLKRE
jgi:hypothetical protein